MPWYQVKSVREEVEGGREYIFRIFGDGDSIGPDVYAEVVATSRKDAQEVVKTAIHELKGWTVAGIPLSATDDRLLSLSVTIPKGDLPFVEASEHEGRVSFGFLRTSKDSKTGPFLEAIVRSDSPSEGAEILISEFENHFNDFSELALFPIEVTDERVLRLEVCLDHRVLHAWSDH